MMSCVAVGGTWAIAFWIQVGWSSGTTTLCFNVMDAEIRFSMIALIIGGYNVTFSDSLQVMHPTS